MVDEGTMAWFSPFGLPLLSVVFVFSWLLLRKQARGGEASNVFSRRRLGKPKSKENTIQKLIRTGVYEVQGLRESMEDAHTVELDLRGTTNAEASNCVFLGVYDGHGGRRAADYVAHNLPIKCTDQENFLEDTKAALASAIAQIEEEFLQLSDKNNWGDGTTVVIAVIRDNRLIVANVGDSECVISSKGKAYALTEIHNPSKNDDEITRVKKAGGKIVQKRVGHPSLNVNYFNLGLSRAIGDDMYKNSRHTDGKPSGITAEPFVTDIELDPEEDDFLIVACDGLWDVFTHKEAVDYVRKQLQVTEDLKEVCKNLVNEALRMGSTDNISAIIATWKNFIR
mmetsp:Transcript_10432/g.12870  ORF Transcript_10432/g.12870 Transcript_10432/m.12870 type:complete len:339 (-) Transcript_10432:22-1038(-)